MGRPHLVNENTVVLLGNTSKKSTSVYWLLYFGKMLFPANVNRVSLRLLSPDKVQVLPDPAGFKITFPSKGYEQWLISANRLVSFYLSALSMTPRQFNRILRQRGIDNIQIQLKLLKNPLPNNDEQDDYFPKIVFNTQPLIELLEEITSKKMHFGRFNFPITLRRQEKFPEGQTCFYFYDFGRKGWVIIMRVPPELSGVLNSLGNTTKEKTVVDIHLSTPATLEIALYPGKDIQRVLEYGYIDVTKEIRPFIEWELKRAKWHKKKVCTPIVSTNRGDRCGAVEISWLELLRSLHNE